MQGIQRYLLLLAGLMGLSPVDALQCNPVVPNVPMCNLHCQCVGPTGCSNEAAGWASPRGYLSP
jgi:hypothetical protein